jgi:hypothetical protein
MKTCLSFLIITVFSTNIALMIYYLTVVACMINSVKVQAALYLVEYLSCQICFEIQCYRSFRTK